MRWDGTTYGKGNVWDRKIVLYDEGVMVMATIYNGIPWYDQNGDTVNAHGACILKENEKYYLFGEYKTNGKNKYIGFSCYSSENLTNWYFEGLALPPQKDGLLGGERIGERVKVVKSKKTGKYVMLMHTDSLDYNDPCIGVAISDTIAGEYSFVGPLLYNGEPVKKWDMGTFVDDDGETYLLTHEGYIYRLSEDCTEAVELMSSEFAPGGESPAMFKKDGVYYIMFSNKTSWERNDNYYFTAESLYGPWEKRGLFCPVGSLTHNSQCSFVFWEDKTKSPIYIGDRWSFPRQGSSATLVILPIKVANGEISIPEYMERWSLETEEQESFETVNPINFKSNVKGDSFEIEFSGSKVYLFGTSDNNGGYARVEILSDKGESIHTSVIDFYSLVESSALKYASPSLEKNDYILRITVMGEAGEWFKKDGTRFGSDDVYVSVSAYAVK